MATTGSQVLQALGMMLDDKQRREERKDLLEFQRAEKSLDLAYREKTARTQRQIQVQTQLFNKNLNEVNALKTNVQNKLIEDIEFKESWDALGLDLNSEHSTSGANLFADNSISEIDALVNATVSLDSEKRDLQTKLGKVAEINHNINDLTQNLTLNTDYSGGDNKDKYDISDYQTVYDSWAKDNIPEGTPASIKELYNEVFVEQTSIGKLREANVELSKMMTEAYKQDTARLKNEMETKKAAGIIVDPAEQAKYYETMLDIQAKEVAPLKELGNAAGEAIVPHFKTTKDETFKDSAAWKNVKEGFKEQMGDQILFDGKGAVDEEGNPLTFKTLLAEDGELMTALQDIGTKASIGFNYLAVGSLGAKEGGLKEVLLYTNKEGKTILELAMGEQNAELYSRFVSEATSHRLRAKDLAKEMYPTLNDEAIDAVVTLNEEENNNKLIEKDASLHDVEDLNDQTNVDISSHFLPGDTLSHRLIGEEGLKEYVYEDTEGYLTAGIGHKLEGEDLQLYVEGDIIPEWQILEWFEKDKEDAVKASDAQMKELGLEGNAEFSEALTDVNFQLGVNWRQKFPKAFEALKAGDYDQAVWEIYHKPDGAPSKWSKQTKDRVDNFAAAINKVAFDEFAPTNFNLTTDFDASKDLNMPILEEGEEMPSNMTNREVLMELEKELGDANLQDVAAFISKNNEMITSGVYSPHARYRALAPLVEIAAGKTGENAFFGEEGKVGRVNVSTLDEGELRKDMGYGTMGSEYNNTLSYNTSGEMREDFNLDNLADSLANVDDYGDALATLNLLKGIKSISGETGGSLSGLYQGENERLVDDAWSEIIDLDMYKILAESAERAPNNQDLQEKLSTFIEERFKERGVNI